jgi:anaerobic magnesium-protoporphyrin IX monomethyl ester cyclase
MGKDWTSFSSDEAQRRVIQIDLRKWDYKHQVLATRHLAPWRVLLWFKSIEAAMQLRPRALARLLAHPDRSLRAAMAWYYRIGRRVWPFEILQFIFRDKRTRKGPLLAEFQADRPLPAPASPEPLREYRTQRAVVKMGI